VRAGPNEQKGEKRSDRKVRKTIITLRKPIQMNKSVGRGCWKRRGKENDNDLDRADPNEQKSEK